MSSREPFDEPDGPDGPDESGVPGELSGPGGLDALEAELLALGDDLDVPAPPPADVADHGRVVSMFWPGGVRLDQFDGTLDPVFFKKLGPPWPDYVKVAGRTAWWIPGAHPLGYLTREDGTELPLRQAGPTLVWQQGTTGYRLEGLRTSDEAVRVAESLE